jgi:hypothetical protein
MVDIQLSYKELGDPDDKNSPKCIIGRVEITKTEDIYTRHLHYEQEHERLITSVNNPFDDQSSSEDNSSSSDEEPPRIHSVSRTGQRTTRIMIKRRWMH